MKPILKVKDALKDLSKGKLSENEIEIGGHVKELGIYLNEVHKGLWKKYEFTKDLNSGNLNHELTLLGDDDLLGVEMFTLQINLQQTDLERKKFDEENEKKRYINEGLAKFSEIIHVGYDKIEKLTDAFIRELCKYLNCLQVEYFLLMMKRKINFFLFHRHLPTTEKIHVAKGSIGRRVGWHLRS
ncbi:MAG: hypothetical protein HC906_02910 [Bacteroidales bacterium]|nr:hypothetical protein [Bacteroidales bacterium]